MTHATDIYPLLKTLSGPNRDRFKIFSSTWEPHNKHIYNSPSRFQEFTAMRQVSSARCPQRCNHLAVTAGSVPSPEGRKEMQLRTVLRSRHTAGLGTAGLRPENGRRRGALQVSTAPVAPGRRACRRLVWVPSPPPGRERLPGPAAGGRTWSWVWAAWERTWCRRLCAPALWPVRSLPVQRSRCSCPGRVCGPPRRADWRAGTDQAERPPEIGGAWWSHAHPRKRLARSCSQSFQSLGGTVTERDAGVGRHGDPRGHLESALLRRPAGVTEDFTGLLRLTRVMPASRSCNGLWWSVCTVAAVPGPESSGICDGCYIKGGKTFLSPLATNWFNHWFPWGSEAWLVLSAWDRWYWLANQNPQFSFLILFFSLNFKWKGILSKLSPHAPFHPHL
jgi:hypothetical protein